MSISRLEQIKSKLRTYDEASIFRSIEELGSRNAVGPLVPMPYDPSKPFHQLTTVRCNVSSISNEMLAPLGPAVHRNFAVIPPAWREHQDMLQFVAGEMLRSGMNFTLVTNHSNVVDIALVLGALRLELATLIGGEEFSQSSGLIISRGIATTKADLSNLGINMPTVEALQLFANIFFSFPTTASVRSKNFPAELIKLSNELTRIELGKFLKPGGRLLAVAPSASKDIFLRDRVHMQPLKNGTMDIMQGWVIPVAVTLDSSEPPACKVLPWRIVKSYEDCHQTMRDIAHECYRQTLIPHHYYDKPSLFEEAKANISKLRRS